MTTLKKSVDTMTGLKDLVIVTGIDYFPHDYVQEGNEIMEFVEEDSPQLDHPDFETYGPLTLEGGSFQQWKLPKIRLVYGWRRCV
jgi:hypothetical protein